MTVKFCFLIAWIFTNLSVLLISVLASNFQRAGTFALYFMYCKSLIHSYNDDHEEKKTFWLFSTCCAPLPSSPPSSSSASFSALISAQVADLCGLYHLSFLTLWLSIRICQQEVSARQEAVGRERGSSTISTTHNCSLPALQEFCPWLCSSVATNPSRQPLLHGFSSRQVPPTQFTLCPFRQRDSKNSYCHQSLGTSPSLVCFLNAAHTSVTSPFIKPTLLIPLKMCYLFPARTLTNIAP